MKKFLFACMALCIGLTYVDAQTILLSEDFEGGIPGTWSRQTDPTSTGWLSGTNTSLSSTSWTIPAPATGTGIVAVNDDGCGVTCDAYDWLTSYNFNALGYDSVRIYFNAFYDQFSTEEAAVVYNYDGNPANYFGGTITTNTTGEWENWYVTVPSSRLSANFHIGFLYNDDFEWGYGFAVDSVRVVGYTSPSNDNCAGATVLIHGTSCTPTSGSVSGAGFSGIAAGTCGGTPTDDVWYSFVAQSPAATVTLQGIGGFDGVLEVFQGGSCGTLTPIGCADATLEGEIETINPSNLVIGNTYYIRVYDYYAQATSPANSNFTICVEQIPTCNLTQPVGSIIENETCGSTINDGCNLLPQTPAYQDISCGDVIWGSANNDGTTRDTDWYRFTLGTPTSVSWIVESQFPADLIFVDITNCSSPTIIAGLVSDPCQPTTLTHNFTSAGTYVAFVSPSIGYNCGANNNYIATLSINTTTPTITAGGPTTFCQGGSVTLTASGGTIFQWNDVNGPINGQTASTFTATASGSYNVTSTDGNGCSATSATTTVTVNPLDDATFNYGSSIFCLTGSNPVPTVNAAGTFSASPSGLSFVSASTGEINLTSTATATYTVTYTTSGTCPNTSAQTLTVTSSPVADFTYANVAYCTNGTNPSPILGTGASAGTFSSSTGLVINASSGLIDLAVSTPGTYTVTNSIAASGGCAAASATFNVTINAIPTISFAPASVCESAPSFALTATPNGGIFTGTSVTGSNFDPSAGTQTVNYSYTDGNNCTATASALITVTPSTDTFSYSQSDYCEGSANVAPTVSGVGTFSASSSDLVFVSTSTGEIDIAGSEVGNYVVTFTSTGSCPNVVTQAVNIVQATIADFSFANVEYCLNSANTLPTLGTGSVAGTFTSSTGLVFANANTGEVDFVASTAGNYTITNTVAASGVCPAATATFDITVHALPTVTLTGGGAICTGSGDAVDVTLTVTGTGPWNVIVNNGMVDIPFPVSTSPQTSPIDENGAGTYTLVSVTDAYCTNTGTGNITITVNPLPVITVNNIAVCEDAIPFTLDNATPIGGAYSGTGVTGGQFDPAVGTQTINYEFTDVNGCVGSGTGTVTVNTLPTVTFAPASVCEGSAPFTPTAAPASGTFSGTGVTANQFDPAAGTQTITYNFTDGNNCSASASALISVLPRPTATITGGGGTFCQGASTNVAVALTGTSPWELVINNGTNNNTVSNITASPYTITASQSGTYTIATVTDALCTDAGTGSAVVTVNPLPTVVFEDVAVCDDVTNVTLSATPLGGTYTGTGVTGNQFNTQSGTQNITYTFTNSNNCSGSATATITVNESPTVTLSLPQMVCVYGTSFTLTGESPAGGTYFGNGITGNTFNPSAAGLGNQFVNYTYTNSDNCSATAIGNITVSQCLDIEESGIENIVSVYPNPAVDWVNFKFSAEANNVLIKIMSTEGKTVYKNQFQSNQATVNVNTFARGIYFVNITVDGKVYTSKIVLN